MTPSQRRHDISDKVWALPEPYLPGQSGQWGSIAKDNRLAYQCRVLDHAHGRTMA